MGQGWEPKPVTTHFIGRILCFSWQILITLYFDHTVECYISTSKLNLTRSLLMKKKFKIYNTSICVVTKIPIPSRKSVQI